MKTFILTLLSLVLLAASPALAEPRTLSLTIDHGVPLTLESPASSVFVANPDIADVQVLSPTQIMLFGKRTGETSFMATDNRGLVLAERTLVVSQDLSALREEIRYAIPGNDITVKSVPSGIILTGTARDAASVADAYKISMRYLPEGGDIINRVQVTGSNQIHIRVRFAEVQRNIDNSLGFNWQTLLTAGSNLTVGFATGNGINMVGTGVFNSGTANNTGLFPRPNNTSLGVPNAVLGAAGTIGDLSIDGMIDAMAQEGMLSILAEPNLTAMSGETANFLAGGEFPIPVPQDNGAIGIQFRSYGISLSFTPTVLSGDRISLHVRPEVSELTEAGSITLSNIAIPALTSRKAETTVEVASGESFAIAGLMNNSQAQTINKFPMLGDLPVIGALFRSDHFVNGQTELVVIITPYIVKPSKKQLALPTDGYSPPSERDRYTKLRYSSSDPKARPVSGEPVGAMKVPSATPPAAEKAEAAPEATSNLMTKSQAEAAAAAQEKKPATTNLKVKAPAEAKKKAAPAKAATAKTAAPAPKASAPAEAAPVEETTEKVAPSINNLTPKSQVEPKKVAPAPAPAPVAAPAPKAAPVQAVTE
ncbi:MAG: type II and III secretion system protein family protein, partial [Bdellovibrionales bacterium]